VNRILGVDVSALFARVVSFSLRRAAAVTAVVAALTLAGLVLALGLAPDAGPGSVLGGDNAATSATRDLHRAFGGEPVTILVKGRLTRLLLTDDVQQLLGLEGCISGNLPAAGKTLAPVCREFAKRKPVQVVYGPGTFINDAAGRILDQVGLNQARVQRESDRAARRAIRAARAQGLDRQAQQGAAEQARSLATTTLMQRVQLQTGLQSIPALNNPRFVLQLVFTTTNVDQPKSRFAYVAPGRDAGLIQARLRSDLSASERSRAIDMVREAVSSRAFSLKAGSYVMGGDPVLREGVESGLSNQAAIVLVAAVLLVALALALSFRARLPLLALVPALAVAAVTYGLARLAGASLTLAVVALLPVLIALAAAIAAALQGRETGPDAARVALAGLVAAVGLVALLVSPVPMMRTFAVMALAGIVLSFAVALTAGVVLVRGRPILPSAVAARLARIARRFPSPRSGPRRPFPGTRRVGARAGALLAALRRRPGRTLWIAVALSVLGWGLGTQIEVVSDLGRLVPSERREVRDSKLVQEATGAEGQVSVLVHGSDLTDPRAIAWMSDYQGRMLTRQGYSEREPCTKARLCPALSVTNVFGSGLPRTKRQVRAALRSLPRYFRGNVITSDRRTAAIGFVLSEMSPERRREVIGDMRSQLDPPAGVTAELAGEPVVDDAVRSDLETSRWTLGLAAILLLLGLLFVLYGRIEHAIVPLVPAVLATGWAALAIWALQVPLNPVSAALGALMIAAGTALATVFYSRYGAARAAGRSASEAIDEAWKGPAGDVTVASAVLAAGSLALTASDFKLLRDFGVVGLVGLLLELVALVVVLPATLLVADDDIARRLPRSAPARIRRLLSGLLSGLRSGLRRDKRVR
jgi:uncharacterized protein